MIIRFRTKDGTFRVTVEPSSSFSEALLQLRPQLPAAASSVTVSKQPTEVGEPHSREWDRPVSELGIHNGDLFFVSYVQETSPAPVSATEPVLTDDVLDLFLSTKDGRIARGQTHLCTHGTKGMCEYCQPLEPYDEEYQQEKGIKHTSVHAWRKKVLEEGGSLVEPSYGVKPCRNAHKPWPEGYCSACQPPAVTLQFQKFRIVDHVEFSAPAIVGQFIEFWRRTSKQRFGFLIGRYAAYDAVPLGIKAEVHAIWEPEQSDDVDGLLMSPHVPQSVHRACDILGLEIVGLVFTDLVDAGGKVLCKRHRDSYFLTSLEVAMAARMQNAHRHNLLGEPFSSRFVTCCISGNVESEIDIFCYQASVQAEALVAADLIVPSTNPAVMRIQPPSKLRYVPDMFYKRVNEYGLTVLEKAAPAFPVDYLLTSLSHGFVAGENAKEVPPFAIENRAELRRQTRAQLVDALGLQTGVNVAALHNFHALLYLLHLDVLDKDELGLLKQLANTKNLQEQTLLEQQLLHSGGIAQLRASA